MKEEESIQCAVVEYLGYQYPHIKSTISPIMSCSIQQGVKQKRMGYSKGSLDLVIYGYSYDLQFNALFIEFKTKKGPVSTEQKEWIKYLLNTGFRATVCRSIEEGIAEIDKYFKGL